MENKDQRNQIPDNHDGLMDEKTSPTHNDNVESSPETDENQNRETTPSEPVKETESPKKETSEVKEEALLQIEKEASIDEPEPKTEESKSVEVEAKKLPEATEQKPVEAEPETIGQEPAVIEAEKMPEAAEQDPVDAGPETVGQNPAESEPEINETATAEDEKLPVVNQVVEIDSEEEEEEEEDEEHVEHEVHDEQADLAIPNYEELKREELIEHLETIVGEDDVTKIKSRVALIKVAFLHKNKELKESNYQEFLDDGGEKENYSPEKDDLETKFNQLFDIYKHKRAIYLEKLEEEKQENLKKKQAILEELKNLIGSEETLKKTYDDFRELQERWREIGMVPKTEVNNLWQTYHFLVEKFFDKVKINKELKDLDLRKNLEQKIELCEKVEELLLETSIIKSFRQLQRYHEQWKEIGPVPEDKNDEIWERFKSTTDKINQRRRDHYKQLQEEQENNLASKVALCEKADNLLAEEVTTIRGWQERTRQFNDLFKVWKTIGQAPKKQNDEIWERFKASLDAFFTEKKEYFSKIKEQQVNNYNMKLELCLQAEALKDSDDWRDSTRELINLQKEWKRIGPVPRKSADKIWQRFREACDTFFDRKTEHFSSIRNEESDNLKKKEDIIKQVENYKFGTDKSKNLELLKDFQRQWTEIGFVPFKDKDRLQNVFRTAINKKLDQLNISDSEMSLAHYTSRLDVMKNTPEGNRQLQREQNFIQNKITKLREDIMLWENNIGFLADTKNANIFKTEFEKKIEKAKNELNVLESKMKILAK
jgi:hypothetical protein